MANRKNSKPAPSLNPALEISDKLSKAIAFVRAGHMAANALRADECDPIQEILDAAVDCMLEAQVTANEWSPRAPA